MSRIGKKPVALPKGVTASVDGQTVKVKGPKGELSVKLVPEVSAKVDEHGITITPDKDQERAAQMWGLSRSLVNNLVTGVTTGFTQKLTLKLELVERRDKGNCQTAAQPLIGGLLRINWRGIKWLSSVSSSDRHRSAK